MGHHFELYLERQISSGRRKRRVHWPHAVVLRGAAISGGRLLMHPLL